MSDAAEKDTTQTFQNRIRDEQLKKMFDPDATEDGATVEPAYKKPLDLFLRGRWMEKTKWVADNEYLALEGWAVHMQPAVNPSGESVVMREAERWLKSTISNTNFLLKTSPTRHFLEALQMLDQGREKDLGSDHKEALKNGQSILANLMTTISQFSPISPEIPLAFTNKFLPPEKGKKREKFDIGIAAGKVYAEMVLPHLQTILDPKTISYKHEYDYCDDLA